jgi:hypothetical protein
MKKYFQLIAFETIQFLNLKKLIKNKKNCKQPP